MAPLAPLSRPCPAASGSTALGLGVDPTVYLDEKKRFLEHLNEIRRISRGPDQNDSSGYGLYLVRLPVSIQPGSCTYQGHGADLSLNVEHEFPPEFLPTTFENLVINDLADQLGPFLYEIIRTGTFDKYLKKYHDAKVKQPVLESQSLRFLEDLIASIQSKILDAQQGTVILDPPGPPGFTDADWRDMLTGFILRLSRPLSGDPLKDGLVLETIAKRWKFSQMPSSLPMPAYWQPPPRSDRVMDSLTSSLPKSAKKSKRSCLRSSQIGSSRATLAGHCFPISTSSSPWSVAST